MKTITVQMVLKTGHMHLIHLSAGSQWKDKTYQQYIETINNALPGYPPFAEMMYQTLDGDYAKTPISKIKELKYISGW